MFFFSASFQLVLISSMLLTFAVCRPDSSGAGERRRCESVVFAFVREEERNDGQWSDKELTKEV